MTDAVSCQNFAPGRGVTVPKTILSCALPAFPEDNCAMVSAAPFRTGSALRAVGADFLPGLRGPLVSACRRLPGTKASVASSLEWCMAEARYQCAGCGEWNDTFVDESAGGRQQYVEDCQVCCKPNLLDIRWSATDGGFAIHAELES
jgi:hypothetical protein